MVALHPLEVLFWPVTFLVWNLWRSFWRLLTPRTARHPDDDRVSSALAFMDWLRIGVFLVVGVGAYFLMPPMLLAWKPAIIGAAWIIGLPFARQKTVVAIANTGSNLLWVAVYDVFLSALLGVMIATPFVR